jgi:hypothetical protein
MRSQLLAFTALAVIAAAPAFAQATNYHTTPPPTRVVPGPGKVVTGPPGLPSVEPLSRRASNINSSDTRSVIAPALPSTDLGPNAGPADYLQAAQSALAANETGRAQEALENAETLLLTRSVPQGATDQADQRPAVRNVNAALQALGAHDNAQAMNLIQQTIPMTNQMTASGGPGMPAGQMSPPMNSPMSPPPPPGAPPPQ